MATGAIGQTVDLRSRILNAARQRFFDMGFFAATTRDIAAQAGTSESGVFRLFGSKYELLMAVYDDCWHEVNVEIEKRSRESETRDPRNQILDTIRIVLSLYDEEPLLMTFIIMNTGNTDTLLLEKKETAIITVENLRYIQRLERLCERCVDRQLAIRGMTTAALREGLLGLVEGILLGWYLADRGAGKYPDKISLEEALGVVAALLYGGEPCDHSCT